MVSDLSFINATTIGDSLYNELSLVEKCKKKKAKIFYVEMGMAGKCNIQAKEIS